MGWCNDGLEGKISCLPYQTQIQFLVLSMQKKKMNDLPKVIQLRNCRNSKPGGMFLKPELLL